VSTPTGSRTRRDAVCRTPGDSAGLPRPHQLPGPSPGEFDLRRLKTRRMDSDTHFFSAYPVKHKDQLFNPAGATRVLHLCPTAPVASSDALRRHDEDHGVA